MTGETLVFVLSAEPLTLPGRASALLCTAVQVQGQPLQQGMQLMAPNGAFAVRGLEFPTPRPIEGLLGFTLPADAQVQSGSFISTIRVVFNPKRFYAALQSPLKHLAIEMLIEGRACPAAVWAPLPSSAQPVVFGEVLMESGTLLPSSTTVKRGMWSGELRNITALNIQLLPVMASRVRVAGVDFHTLRDVNNSDDAVHPERTVDTSVPTRSERRG